MATILKAGNVASGAQITSDATGILEIRTGTGAGTTAITVGTNQAVTFAAGTTVSSLTTSGAVSAGSLTVNSNNISAVNSLGFRNRIINGDCRIDQRNNGASVTGNTAVWPVDRFVIEANQTSKLTTGRNLNSVTPPAGFTNYMGFQSSSAYSVLAGDFFAVRQVVEGFNWADLGYGTANARTSTLSFWVYSSLTGTFGGSLRGFDAVSTIRSYPFTYTISSANTWEYKTITIPGDTTASSAWTSAQSTTNGYGLLVGFGLGAGSTFSGAAGSWSSSNLLTATGAVSVVGTNGATFYITGVQLEAGSVATPFERRDYGRELMMCYRYFYKQDVPFFQNCTYASGAFTTNGQLGVSFPVVMRAAPTVTVAFTNRDNTSSVSVSGLGGSVTPQGVRYSFTVVQVTFPYAGFDLTSSNSAEL